MRVCWWLKAKVCVIQEATVFPPALNTRSYHLALQSLPTGPALSLSLSLSLSLALSPGTVLALSCFLGLAGPGRTDPDPSFSCSPTEMPSGWCEWLPQQRPGDLQPAGTKVTPPQRFALSLPSFHQPAGELFILYSLRGTNLLHKHPPKKNCTLSLLI